MGDKSEDWRGDASENWHLTSSANVFRLELMLAKLVTIKVEKIDHQETGRRCRVLREEAGLSLRKVAELMGLSPPYLSDIERGRRNWSAVLLQQYNNALQGIKT